MKISKGRDQALFKRPNIFFIIALLVILQTVGPASAASQNDKAAAVENKGVAAKNTVENKGMDKKTEKADTGAETKNSGKKNTPEKKNVEETKAEPKKAEAPKKGEAFKNIEDKKKNDEKKSKELEFLKFIPDEFRFVARVNVQAFLSEVSEKAFGEYINMIFGKKNLGKLKTLDISFSPERTKDQTFNFICVAGGDIDFAEMFDTIKNYADVKTGEHEGFQVFRYYNLAGLVCNGRVILGTAASLKKIVEMVKTGNGSLYNNNEFAAKCESAFAKSKLKNYAMTGAIGNDFLKKALADHEITYKEGLLATDMLYFTFSEKKVEMILSQDSSETALKLSNELAEQFQQSAKETAEALGEVDLIEAESKNRREQKVMAGELAFTRKLLNLTAEFNKNGNFKTADRDIFVGVEFKENILRSICSVITSHPNSWGAILEYFISPAITCKKYAKIIETATLIYLSKHKEAKASVSEEALYTEGIITNFYKCPAGDKFEISVDEKGKISVKCPVHDGAAK